MIEKTQNDDVNMTAVETVAAILESYVVPTLPVEMETAILQRDDVTKFHAMKTQVLKTTIFWEVIAKQTAVM